VSVKTSHWPRLRKDPEWRGRSVEERARAVELACRTAIQLLSDARDREARLTRIDPVPPSTRALLRRLANAGNG
jgi:hypothetical protein